MIIVTYDKNTYLRKKTYPIFNSFISNKRFFDIGSFELHIKRCEIELGDIIQAGNFFGIVKRVVIEPNGTGIFGYDLKGLLKQRVFESEMAFSNQIPENILISVANTMLNTGDRTIYNFVNAASSGAGTAIDYTFERGKNVADELTTFCQANKISYDIVLENGHIKFKIAVPRDKTNYLFDRRCHNIGELQYITGNYDFANTVYYMDSNEQTAIQGASTGIDRFEYYTEKEEDINKVLQKQALEETIDGKSVNLNLIDEDLRLGDVVSVSYNNNITEKTITELETVYEHSTMRIKPIFGIEKENPIKKLFREG